MTEAVYIGRAMRLAREFHRISLSEMVEKSGRSKAYLSQIETGKRTPPIEIVESYAEVCGISLSEIILFAESVSGRRGSGRIARKAMRMMEWAVEIGAEAKG